MRKFENGVKIFYKYTSVLVMNCREAARERGEGVILSPHYHWDVKWDVKWWGIIFADIFRPRDTISRVSRVSATQESEYKKWNQ